MCARRKYRLIPCDEQIHLIQQNNRYSPFPWALVARKHSFQMFQRSCWSILVARQGLQCSRS